MKKVLDIIEIVMKIFLIILGIIIIYQIILKIFGGSWTIENIIVALLTTNIGLTFVLAINQAKTDARLGYLE